MTDRNDMYAADADAKREELPPDQDALSDQDLDQAAGGVMRAKTGDAAEADMAAPKNDKPESDVLSF